MFPFDHQRHLTRPYLASIANKDEEIFLNSLLGGTGNVWVGGKRLQDGTWIWIDGTEFSYTNWAPGQPDSNTNGGIEAKEDSIMINWRSNGKWNDIIDSGITDESYQNGFICQYNAF